MRAQFVLSEIWIGLRRNLTMTIALVVTVAIALALFGTGLLIRAQVNGMQDFWYDKIEVSIFLCVESSANPQCQAIGGQATQQQKDQIKQQLEGMPEVQRVYYESQQQAYDRFEDSYSGTPAFTQSTRPEDMPDSFRVKLTDPNRYEAVQSAIQGRQGVDSLLNEKQLLERFFRVLNGLQWTALLIAMIQVVAAILLIGNTIRLAAYNRRRETGIMRLVGASNLYIQLPFLLEGAIAGLAGGLIASVLIVLSKPLLFDRLQESFAYTVALDWTSVVQVIVVSIVTGILLCALASFLTLRRYMRI